MAVYTGVYFGDRHSYVDWGLRLKSVEIGFPEAKTVLLDIPGADGVLDLTESLTGDVHYDMRKLTFTFDAKGKTYEDWTGLISDIADELHGQSVKIIMDIDPDYYYTGRCQISTSKSNRVRSEIVITCTVEPYKSERFSSAEPWEWDPFNFEKGIIREYTDLVVDGSLTVRAVGSRKVVVPSFTVASDDGNGMTVTFDGTTYSLPDGTSYVVNIRIENSEYELVFKGHGTVTIDYRGGKL